MQRLTDISRCEAVVATYYVAETIEAQYHARHRYGLVRGQYVSSTSEVSASRTPRHGVSLMIQHIVASRRSFNASTFGTFPLGHECAFCAGDDAFCVWISGKDIRKSTANDIILP